MPGSISTITSLISPVSVAIETPARDWFTEQACRYDLHWLLAHADNGVIWGELRDQTLYLSCDAFGPEGLILKWETLQQARLFGPAGELRVWPGPQGWQARLRCDDAGEPCEYIEEQHLLWGTRAGETRDGFTEVTEGSQGIIHTPPISVTPSEKRRTALLVRHYISEDEAGVARIVDSRLVELQAPEVK